MKNLILIVIVSLIMAVTYSSCKKDDPCPFNKSTFQNKTYKIKFYYDSNGIDITNKYSPFIRCYDSTYTTFKPDGTYTFDTRGCISDNEGGTWSTLSENNKNYIVFNGIKQEVSDFNCNYFNVKLVYVDIKTTLTINTRFTAGN